MEGKATNKRQAEVFQSESIRDIVSTINEKGVQKDDIVSVLQDARTNEFILIYYI